MHTGTVAITLPIDHPNLAAILTLASDGSMPQAKLDIEVTRTEVVERLLAADLNDREVAFLNALALNAPATVTYEELVRLVDGPQRLGNVTSGLFRRWRARGGDEGDVPWPDVPNEGRRMSSEDAVLVRAALHSRMELIK